MGKQLGKFLQVLRDGRSLREVEKRTGISHTYLNTLEKGYDPRTNKPRKPNPDVLRRLAICYEVSYIELMRYAGYLTEKDLIEFRKEDN